MIPPLPTLIRKLRPLAVQVTLCVYIFHRICHLHGSSILKTLATSWDDSSSKISHLIILTFDGDDQVLSKILLFMFEITSTVLQDAIAILGIIRLLHFTSRIYCTLTWKLKDPSISLIFQYILTNIPRFRNEMQKAANKVLKEADSMLGKNPKRSIRRVIPSKGMSSDNIINELSSCASKENNRCESGRISGTLYADGKRHSELMSQVYGLYQWANPLKPGVWPRVNQCEAEIISMTANFLHSPSPPRGCVTSGGTESIFSTVRAHLEFYGKRRGIAYPEIICGTTAHCALNKACEVLKIRLVSIDCNGSETFELPVSQVRKRITSNTIMIFASAPCWPHGVIDPIDRLSELAILFDIGLHVDACLGGFILPFCENSSKLFDFQCKGVSSISADTHKYGYATKGTSVIIFRFLDLQHASYFTYSRWAGGLYTTPTLAGSRPGALIACAWAAMISIGEEGYRTRAKSIISKARRISDGIRSIKGLKILTPNPTIVVSFGSEELNAYRIKDAMSSMGWSLNPLQNPPAINLVVTESLVVKEFLESLNEAVHCVRDEKTEERKRGTASIYHAVKILPTFTIEFVMRLFVDASLSP